MDGAYLQLGYVTNDFDQAVHMIQDLRGLGPFKELRDLTIGARGDKTVTCHFAMAFKDGTQFEIIHPLDGDCAFYTDALPQGGGFAMALHHTGHYYPDSDGYIVAKALAEGRWEKPVDHKIFDGCYCYFDARGELGHHVELYTFPSEAHLEDIPRY